MLALREQPNQFVAENQKDAEWFINNVRYVAEKYNTQQNNLGYRNISTLDKPIDEMLRMFSYYLGKQDNRDYYYATQDQDNCDLPTVSCCILDYPSEYLRVIESDAYLVRKYAL